MRTLITCLFALFLTAGSTIAQPGATDHTFNPGDFGFGYGPTSPNSVSSMAVQPDGKIVLVGIDSYADTPCNGIVRVNSNDGSIDTGFDSGNGANGMIRSVALQPDGKIIIGGDFTTYGGTNRNRIARLNTDGSLDAAFDPGLGANGPVHHVLIQPNGKVLIRGAFSEFNGVARSQLCRLNSNGTLDIAYIANWSSPNFTILSGMCLTSGGLLFIGCGGSANAGYVVLNDNGYQVNDVILASNWGPNPGSALIHHVSELSNGSMAFSGYRTAFYDGVSILRFGSTVFDATVASVPSPPFYQVNYPPGAPNGRVHWILPLDDGTAIIRGDFSPDMARVHSNGSWAADFGTDLPESIAQLLPLPDGRFIGFGSVTSRLLRLNSDGSWDASFPAGTGANGVVNAIAVQSDGKILIGGDFQAYNSVATHLARLNADGSLGTAFDTDLPWNSSISGIAVQPNGKVLIAGTIPAGIQRFNADGSTDSGFSPPTLDSTIHVVAAQPDGRIVIGGLFTTVGGQSRNRVARLNADGSVHLSFDPGSGADGAVRTIVPMPAGKTLIGGAFNNYGGFSMAHVAQLNADGTLDPSFNIGSGVTDDTVRVIVRQSDGKVLVAGDFYVFNGVYSPNIVRLNTDGSMDTTFSSGFGVDGRIHCMALQADGKILIGGEFSTYDGIGRNRIARLNSDGSLDMGFNPGTGASATIHALALQPDGKALIGGAFTSYNGTGRNRVARLHNDIGSGVQEYETLALFGHPNPTKGIVTLQLPLQNRPSELSILDATGRLVLSQAIGNATSPVTLDLSAHEIGVYFVHVRFADGTRAVEQIVKE
jgi:uncharacterized delta-60 repeat protein